jgi:hypothetical protein
MAWPVLRGRGRAGRGAAPGPATVVAVTDAGAVSTITRRTPRIRLSAATTVA